MKILMALAMFLMLTFIAQAQTAEPTPPTPELTPTTSGCPISC